MKTDNLQLANDYILYVEAKIEIQEMPFTFDQWMQANEDMK